MPRQFKNARLIKHLKVADAIKLLGVSQPTLSAWEGERKSPSIEKLELMADIYETSTDYLLGRIRIYKNVPSNPISLSCLPVLHEQPLWSPEYGWMLVNSIEKHLVRSDGKTIPFSTAGNLYTTPPIFSVPQTLPEAPLTRTQMLANEEMWVEPISPDSNLRDELRGWYHRKDRYVENEYGNRFYLDTYEAKWLGFDKEQTSTDKNEDAETSPSF